MATDKKPEDMGAMERALYESGAHIVFKEVKDSPQSPHPLRRWKVPLAPGVGKNRKKGKQRMVGGIPRDPVDKTAALVTSPKPKDTL